MKVLNQNVVKTKRKRFATFAVSIVGNLCLLQQWNGTQLNTTSVIKIATET